MRITAFVVVLSLMVAGCSGGSGPGTAQSLPMPPSPPPPVTQVRFVNATPDTGALDFTMGTFHYSVPARDASPVFTVTPGPTTVVVSNGVKTATRTITIPDAPGPNEIAVICAYASRGRPNHRVGGLAVNEIKGIDGLV